MLEFLSVRSFSLRLLLGLFVLILLTTLSAGIPAYWLTRSQLERQAWSQVDNAQKATRSLLQAEQSRLDGLVRLLAERPTLQRLAQAAAVTELRPYLQSFQSQSDLDILLYCDAGNRLLVGEGLVDCSRLPANGFVLLDNRPAILARAVVDDEQSGAFLGTTVAAIWLDEAFLQQLANATGIEQSILSAAGSRLASSIDGVDQADTDSSAAPPEREAMTIGGRPYYATTMPLMSAAGETLLLSEVALPVDDLLATETQALFVLAGSTGLVALLGGLLGIWTMRQLVAPLRKLTRVAEQISRGDLMAPIPLVSSPDEISTLATALHRSQASMLRALQERSYFLANISHEFLTPLSTLNASMELLLDPAEALTAAEMRELLRPTYLSVRALQTLIDNLLESSSIEAGRFTINKRPTDLNQVFEQALHMVGPLLERRRQPVTSTIGASPSAGSGQALVDAQINADAGRLTQALVNLLNNASKYSPPGEPVEVRITQRDGLLRVAVTDHGPGIPAEERMNLFGRFVRRETADGEQYGIGLGLYVVKTTVEAHGGRVGIDDRPGGGSVFWFELPLK
jgi:signal transduction histidine kinase